MKKSYQKPSIYVESYELAQSIAVNCHLDLSQISSVGRPTHAAPGVNSCVWDMGNVSIFTADVDCTIIEDPADFSGESQNGTAICYNAPQDAIQIFASA